MRWNLLIFLTNFASCKTVDVISHRFVVHCKFQLIFGEGDVTHLRNSLIILHSWRNYLTELCGCVVCDRLMKYSSCIDWMLGSCVEVDDNGFIMCLSYLTALLLLMGWIITAVSLMTTCNYKWLDIRKFINCQM